MLNETAINSILTITEVLNRFQIPYSRNSIYDGMQLTFSWSDGDVVAHKGIYGADRGMVESFQFPWDGDNITVDTPDSMASRIICLYFSIE